MRRSKTIMMQKPQEQKYHLVVENLLPWTFTTLDQVIISPRMKPGLKETNVKHQAKRETVKGDHPFM